MNITASILQLHILHSRHSSIHIENINIYQPPSSSYIYSIPGTPGSTWRIYISASILQLHILHSRHSSIYIENIYISLHPPAAYTAFQALLHLYREYIYISLHYPATYNPFQALLHIYL